MNAFILPRVTEAYRILLDVILTGAMGQIRVWFCLAGPGSNYI